MSRDLKSLSASAEVGRGKNRTQPSLPNTLVPAAPEINRGDGNSASSVDASGATMLPRTEFSTSTVDAGGEGDDAIPAPQLSSGTALPALPMLTPDSGSATLAPPMPRRVEALSNSTSLGAQCLAHAPSLIRPFYTIDRNIVLTERKDLNQLLGWPSTRYLATASGTHQVAAAVHIAAAPHVGYTGQRSPHDPAEDRHRAIAVCLVHLEAGNWLFYDTCRNHARGAPCSVIANAPGTCKCAFHGNPSVYTGTTRVHTVHPTTRVFMH